MGRKLLRDESGQSLAEYGLLTALLAIAVIGAARLLGTQLAGTFAEVTQALN